MVNHEQLLKLLEYNLGREDFDNAIKLLNDKEYNEIILSHYPELIQDVVLKHLSKENYEKKPKLYEACEFILKMLAEKCNQQGILFEFLEIIEELEGNQDDVFTSILKALQIIVLSQSDKKSRSLEYVLNSVEDYIIGLELPPLLKKKFLDEEEEKLLENDEQIQRILMLYITLDLFYKPIVQQIIDKPRDNIQDQSFNRRNVIFCFILRLLGTPMSYLDLTHAEGSVRTYSRDVGENLISSLFQLQPNLLNLLQFAEQRSRWPSKKKIDDDFANIFMHSEKTPLLQMGILFYLIIGEGICVEKLPKVYNPA
jgi:glomulin